MVFFAGLISAIAVLLPAGALPDVGGSNLPFAGSVASTSTHNLATGQVHGVGTGQITHFGRAMIVQDAHVAPTGSTPPLSWSGTWTLTAANGDQLFGTSTGTGTPTDTTHITFVIDYTSSGGTGRFADASATFTATIHHTRVALVNGISYGEQTVTLDGQLSW
jgi:hypothetical protein